MNSFLSPRQLLLLEVADMQWEMSSLCLLVLRLVRQLELPYNYTSIAWVSAMLSQQLASSTLLTEAQLPLEDRISQSRLERLNRILRPDQVQVLASLLHNRARRGPSA